MSVAIDTGEFGGRGPVRRRSRPPVHRPRAGDRRHGESIRPDGGRVVYRSGCTTVSRAPHSRSSTEPGWPAMVAGVLMTALVLVGLGQLGHWREGTDVAPAAVTHGHTVSGPGLSRPTAG